MPDWLAAAPGNRQYDSLSTKKGPATFAAILQQRKTRDATLQSGPRLPFADPIPTSLPKEVVAHRWSQCPSQAQPLSAPEAAGDDQVGQAQSAEGADQHGLEAQAIAELLALLGEQTITAARVVHPFCGSDMTSAFKLLVQVGPAERSMR